MKIRAGYLVRVAFMSIFFLISFAAMAGAFESRGVLPPSLYTTSEPQKKDPGLRSVPSRSPKADARSKFPALPTSKSVDVKVPTRSKPNSSKTPEPRRIVETWVPDLSLPETVSIPGITPPLEDVTIVRAPRPRIVVLVHGMQTNDGTHEDGELITGHGYWSFEFAQGILGAEPDQPLFDFTGHQYENQENWTEYADGIILSEGSEGHAFTALEPISPIPGFAGVWHDQAPEEPPMLSVMMTARNASVGLLLQTAQATDQMERLLGWYHERFAGYLDRRCRCEPELVLVAHSQGGHVSRVWLSSAKVDPVDDELNPDHVDFSKAQEQTMSLIRDTTVFLATLGTPHDGTIFASRGWEVYGRIDSSVTTLNEDPSVTTLIDEVYSIEAGINEIESVIPLNSPISDLASVKTAAIDLLDSMPNSVRDLTIEYMFAINGDFLHPMYARRSQKADSRLGNGTSHKYIPIYAFGGRSPGSTHLVDYDLVAGYDGVLSDPEGTGILLMVGIDRWMASYLTGWGSLGGDYADFSDRLDRVDRADLRDVEALVEEYVDEYGEEWIPFPLQLEIAAGPGDLANWLTMGLSHSTDAGDLPIYLQENFRIEPGAGDATLMDPVVTCGSYAFSMGRNLGELLPLEGRLLEMISLEPEAFLTYLEGSPKLVDVIALSLMDDGEQMLEAMAEGDASSLIPTGSSSGEFSVEALALTHLGLLLAINVTIDDLSQSCVYISNWKIQLRSREVQVPGFVAMGEPVSDGEIDSDGAVPYDSAMGFYIGSDNPWAFEHTDGGAWYRRPDSPFEKEFHMGMTTRYHLGAYLYDELVSQAGPIATTANVSVAP